MKKLIIITALLIVCIGTQLNAKPGFEISFGFFYSSLRSYGEWINLEADLTVWRPHGVSRNWRPYSHGRWSWTINGWYWDSYEPFGWATFIMEDGIMMITMAGFGYPIMNGLLPG